MMLLGRRVWRKSWNAAPRASEHPILLASHRTCRCEGSFKSWRRYGLTRDTWPRFAPRARASTSSLKTIVRYAPRHRVAPVCAQMNFPSLNRFLDPGRESSESNTFSRAAADAPIKYTDMPLG